MAVLEKIRVKFGILISVIIALALLSFIIDPGTLQSALASMSTKYDVGNIAGKRISYSEFQEMTEKYTTINELLSTSTSQGEETQSQIRDAAWQELVDKYMFIDNAKAAGIQVGEAELLDLLSGDNVSTAIALNPIFMDETGNFSRQALANFVQTVESDQTGRLRVYWDYLQNTLYTQQYYQKFSALFNASAYENALQIDEALAANNSTADVEYISYYYPMTVDTTIQVSSNEVRQYYKDHKSMFKQNASRDIEYVVYEVVPSSDDINETSLEMDKAYEEFLTTDNMRTFLLKNSDRQLSEYWYKEGELRTINSELDAQIFGGRKATQVISSGNTFYAGREIASRNLPDSVFVKHILLQGDGAEQLADSLAKVASRRGTNFSNLVANYSVDLSSAADGELGSIGWMTQTYMIPGMESVIEAEVGKPYVLNTQYGTHVVLVTAKTKPVAKKQVAILEKTAIASRETFNNYYSQANTFAAIANKSLDGYRKAVDSTKVYSHSLRISEATSTYGAIEGAKEVTRWAFDNKVGKASEIITVNNNYFFIATVTGIHEEGYAPVEEVSSAISDRLYAQKAQEKTVAEVKAKMEGKTSLEAIAEALDATIERNESLSLAATSMDPAVLGAAAVAPVGTVYGPVAGSLAAYVVSVQDKNTESFYTEDDARNLAAQKAQYMSQLILSVMSDYENVKDNRARFF